MAESIQRFIASRKGRWERLEELLQVLEGRKGGRRPTGPDLLEAGRLYREATADLARLQGSRLDGSPPEGLEIFLNQLVARAYGRIYRSPPSGWGPLWVFLRKAFPKVFRETAPWTLAAMGIFVAGFLYGFTAALNDESFAPLVVPSELIQKVEAGEVWFNSILAVRPLASSMIMTNNISVTFLAFALGITFGLGTLYLMAFNGLMGGTLAGLCHIHGLDVAFWSFVLPHGVIELTAIFIGGGGGFLLSTALLFPGDLPRREALVLRGRQAVRLALGCVPLLVIAGVVEGFFSPLPLPVWLNFSVAGMLLALLLLYLLHPLTADPSS
jgi:uncharacterized membrane protein SpoIIM required for sporulation